MGKNAHKRNKPKAKLFSAKNKFSRGSRRPSAKKSRKLSRKGKPKRIKTGFGNQQFFAPVRNTINMQNSGAMKGWTITHKEYVKDLVSSASTGAMEKVEINPGLLNTFPWLSKLATAFESYTIDRLSFIYIPNLGTDVDGTVAIAPDYDPEDDNSLLSKAEILSFADCVRGAIWGPLKMTCSKQNLQKRKTYFVRTGDTTKDKRLTDALQLLIYTNDQDVPDGKVYGELWAEYTITFYTPQREREGAQNYALVNSEIGRASCRERV